MRVIVAPYNPRWKETYVQLQQEISTLLKDLKPHIEHIGSTSIEGMWAKPTVDILVGVAENRLSDVVKGLLEAPYSYIGAFTPGMPERRFFLRMPPDSDFPAVIDEASAITEYINAHKIAHIHAVGHNSPFWLRHIAFREYMRHHIECRQAYQQLKVHLSTIEWENAFQFNEAKSAFIREHEEKALHWYKQSGLR